MYTQIYAETIGFGVVFCVLVEAHRQRGKSFLAFSQQDGHDENYFSTRLGWTGASGKQAGSGCTVQLCVNPGLEWTGSGQDGEC